jgi:hypothetical protein
MVSIRRRSNLGTTRMDEGIQSQSGIRHYVILLAKTGTSEIPILGHGTATSAWQDPPANALADIHPEIDEHRWLMILVHHRSSLGTSPGADRLECGLAGAAFG